MKEIYANEEYKHLRQDCYNYYALCSRWAANGGCEDEEEREFMIGQCSPACLACDLLEELLDKQDEMEEEEEESDILRRRKKKKKKKVMMMMMKRRKKKNQKTMMTTTKTKWKEANL